MFLAALERLDQVAPSERALAVNLHHAGFVIRHFQQRLRPRTALHGGVRHAPAFHKHRQVICVGDALMLDGFAHAKGFRLHLIFLKLGFYRADLHARAALDAVIIRQNQFAAVINMQRARRADISTGQAAFHAFLAPQFHLALPGLLHMESAIAGYLALTAADAVRVIHHQGLLFFISS